MLETDHHIHENRVNSEKFLTVLQGASAWPYILEIEQFIL